MSNPYTSGQLASVRREAIVEVANQVRDHWNDSHTMVNQKKQAQRTADAILVMVAADDVAAPESDEVRINGLVLECMDQKKRLIKREDDIEEIREQLATHLDLIECNKGFIDREKGLREHGIECHANRLAALEAKQPPEPLKRVHALDMNKGFDGMCGPLFKCLHCGKHIPETAHNEYCPGKASC